jgi:hypothetical protein
LDFLVEPNFSHSTDMPVDYYFFFYNVLFRIEVVLVSLIVG